MSIEELVRELDGRTREELWELREAIFVRLREPLDDAEEERECLRRLIERGLVTLPADRARATPESSRPDPIEIDGPPLSEQIIAERR